MEQKKTLWIIAAVGAFLLVVLGTAGILYSPAKNPGPAVASVAPVEKTANKNTSSGWTNYQADVQPPLPVAPADVSAQKVGEMIVLADNTTVYNIPRNSETSTATTIDLNALKNGYLTESEPSAAPVAAREPQSQNINITVNVPEPKETFSEPAPAAEPVQPKEAKDSKKEKASSQSQTQTVQKVATSASSQGKSSSSAASNSSSSNVKVSVNGNASVTVKEEPKKTQFWVQVAAYSNKKGAENARSILDSNKIPADIFTYQDNKDKLFYRVRVGPYTTKSEAEYWRSRIVKIDDFAKAESYITSTTN